MKGITRRGLLRLTAAIPASSLASQLGWPRALGTALASTDAPVLIEAESFTSAGGWVLDQQFDDQMGSSMLLAHGMGVPVADASTEIEIPHAAKYRLWVRTREWASVSNPLSAPGRFEVHVNGKPLAAIFGAEGTRWHWQDGGVVRLDTGRNRLALHDLTGFDGRCDAIFLTANLAFRPPEDAAELASFRKNILHIHAPEDAGVFDFVVAGGGVAGCAAAITAARLGLKVALIHDRPVLGGNASSEVRVSLQGLSHLFPYPALGSVVDEFESGFAASLFDASTCADGMILRAAQAEKNLHLFLRTRVFSIEKDGGAIRAVLAREEISGRELRIRGQLFADCTGDATIGSLAGAESRYGRESRAETGESMAPETADKLVNGATILWSSEDAGNTVDFPETPWAVQFNEETVQNTAQGSWDWETGQLADQIGQFESIRDHALRAIYGNWSYQKNHGARKADYANRRLHWVGYIGGKRESRRLIGDVVLHQQDIQEQKPFIDASVTTSWPIDLHEPSAKNHRDFPGEEFRAICHQISIAQYAIPYRCFYSRNIQNLFMAGRNVSATHVALGTIRVQRTTGMMGEVVGMAAAIASQHTTTPRGVYENYLPQLKASMTRGTGLTALAPPPPSSVPAGYVLAWQDEFDGRSLDESAWNYRTDSKAKSTQLPENVGVRDGNLVLTLDRTAPGAAMKFAGAGVISRQAFNYGYYECRMRVLAGKGWHSSFWLMRHDSSGSTASGAADLELDAIENDAGDLRHYQVTTHRWRGQHDVLGHKVVASNLLSDYHVYGCEYTSEEARYFLDGKLVESTTIHSQPQGEVNIWLTSIATETVDNGRLPCHTDFDYVRYYRKS
ncbi:MAG: FAD-dependent oxidoreductase [Terracidiphilus sp.]|nr:FAD-dependent oxidoreductase [Terracidiphilus sp.]